MSAGASKIQVATLSGHKGAILCLDHGSSVGSVGGSDGLSESCLLSGSEDGTARLWDLRSSPRACTCIIAGDEVTAVHFGPGQQKSDSEESSFSRNFTVYLSVKNSVLSYDLRQASAPVIREATQTLVETEDDINQISISGKRRDRSLYLAAAADDGKVQVVEEERSSKKGKGLSTHALEHGQDGLVTSCVFRPKSKNLELASGCTDFLIKLWDINKPKRPLSTKKVSMNQTGAQLCNPPMVHSLAWSPSGRLLASGLGDGTSSVFLIENRSLVEVARLQDQTASDSPVASVLFPSFVPSESKPHTTAQDRLLAVMRNDAVINMWDLGWAVAGEKATNPSGSMSCFMDQSKASKTEPEDYLEELSLVADQPSLLFKIPHHRKPNWITSSCGSEPHFPSSLFVADTSSDITVYTLPLKG